MTALPLRSIRILDLTMVVAGPYSTLVLADLGAQVIKIEGPTRWDPFRGPRAPHGGHYHGGLGPPHPYNRSLQFNELNRNKLAITLDLSQPQGVRLFKGLARISDVVLENYSPRVMGNFGLDFESLRRERPDIIMVSMPGYGSTGPYRDYVAHGPGVDAMSGMQWLTGHADGLPLKAGGQYCDQTNGLTATFAILTALFHRRRSGKGQHIDVAMREASTQLIGEAFLAYSLTGRVPQRMGNDHPSHAPHGCYPCRGEDEWVTIAVGSDEEWDRFCHALGDPPWTQDPRFATAPGRWHQRRELDGHVAAWTKERAARDVMWLLQEAGVAAGSVSDSQAIVEDPHLLQRDFLQTTQHAQAGENVHCSLPWKVSGQRPPMSRPAPCFGEHNGYVLGELLGLSGTEVEALAAEKVISQEPLV